MKSRIDWLKQDLERFNKKIESLNLFNKLDSEYYSFRCDLYNYYIQQISRIKIKINQENQKKGEII